MPSKDNADLVSDVLAQAYAAADQADWLTVASHLLMLPNPSVVIPQLLDLSLRALATGDFKDAWLLAQTLIKTGELAVPNLMGLLRDDAATPEARWFGARVLEKCPAGSVVGELANYLKDLEACQQPEITELVIRTLVQFGADGIEPLTVLLSQPTHQMAALIALSRIRHSQVIPALLMVVKDGDPELRAIAIEALSSFHDSRVPPVLMNSLMDPDPQTRCFAAQGLGLRPELEGELGLVDQLKPLLMDVDVTVAMVAAVALGRMKSEAAATALFERQMREVCPPELQLQMIQSLGWLDQPLAIDYLQNILSSLPATSEAAIAVIRSLAQQQSYPELVAQVLQEYFQQLPANAPVRLKQELAIACGNFGGNSLVNSLIHLLADEAAPVRWQASYCLRQGGEPTRFYLMKILEESRLSEPVQAAVREFLANSSENHA